MKELPDALDVGFVAGVDGTLEAAAVERAQDPAPVALDRELGDGFPATPGIAHCDEAAIGRGLVGIDSHVVVQPIIAAAGRASELDALQP